MRKLLYRSDLSPLGLRVFIVLVFLLFVVLSLAYKNWEVFFGSLPVGAIFIYCSFSSRDLIISENEIILEKKIFGKQFSTESFSFNNIQKCDIGTDLSQEASNYELFIVCSGSRRALVSSVDHDVIAGLHEQVESKIK